MSFLTDDDMPLTPGDFAWLREHDITEKHVHGCRFEINNYGIAPEKFFANAMLSNRVLALSDPVHNIEHRPMAMRLLAGLKANGATHVCLRAHSDAEHDWLHQYMVMGVETVVPGDKRITHHRPLLEQMRQQKMHFIAVHPESSNTSAWSLMAEFLDDDEANSKFIYWDAARRVRRFNDDEETFADIKYLEDQNYPVCTLVGLHNPLTPSQFDPMPFINLISAGLKFPVVVPTMLSCFIGGLSMSELVQDKLSSWDYVLIYPLLDTQHCC